MVLVTVLVSLAVGVISFILGWFFAVNYFRKQLKENPPISESQIKDLYKRLGRKPSERQIKQIISGFK